MKLKGFIETDTDLYAVIEHHHPECPHSEEYKKGASSGVVSDAYRSGWDNIFGKKQEVGQA